uniref:ATP-dependent RNA helicase n=1 Tax=Glossina brevipalpis TaxID=37001 RepID=A0A1A9W959_9MUSC
MKQKRVRDHQKSQKSAKSLLDEEIQELKAKYEEICCEREKIKCFSDFPLCQKTLKGLSEAKYVEPTEIQRGSIGSALQGKDILAAAITGSGKTLAFLIPVLEHLYVSKWSRLDGVAAIIISPTRELAYQIFETLKRVGKYHDFSAGLIIGGKNLKFERKRMDQCNILICTPGRLLQHMDENPLFDATTMEMLILDEADRCLDMGFEKTLNAIIENFPPGRQNLLFSATQTNSVKDLARLNLREPVCIGCGISEENKLKKLPAQIVPELLQQNYVVVALEDKITMLWSFIKNHLKQKVIVFLSSCKQVKYTYEIFCKLRPGTSLLALYGTLHQDRRIAIYNDFVKKSNVVLFATDIASRGLDFPSVNWVIQLDCPEDVTQYIHRAGRSARNKARGECLLVLLPSEEEAMAAELEKQFINIRKIIIDPKKLFSPRAKIEAFLAQNPELKASAQRAFVAYIKSIFLMKNKKIFNVKALDLEAYAKSLGLILTPRVRFLERFLKRQNNQTQNVIENKIENDSEETEEMEKQQNSFNFETFHNNSESDEEELLTLKRANHAIEDGISSSEDKDLPAPVLRKKEKSLTKASLAKKALKKKIQINERLIFDDEGNEITDQRKQLQSALAKEYDEKLKVSGGIDIGMAKELLQEEDKYDKQRFRELIKKRHKKLKKKLKSAEASGRNKTEEEEGEEYNNSGEDEDDEISVDLSWLPDPKKIYKSKNTNSSNIEDAEIENKEHSDEISSASGSSSSSADDESENDELTEPVRKKAKVTSKLSLNDAEIIAAQLLASSN